MTKGWVIGTQSFKRALREEHKDLAAAMKRGDHEFEDLRVDEREAALFALLKCLEKGAEDVSGDVKGASWKVAIRSLRK